MHTRAHAHAHPHTPPRKARAELSEEAQKKVHVIDTGFIGSEEFTMSREALRCAAAGMGAEATLERIAHVEKRSVGGWVGQSVGP